MKKYLILLAMLLVAVANYAEKPANYVEASQEAYRASDPLMLEDILQVILSRAD